MSTPAINRNSVLTRPGHRTTIQWNATGDLPPSVSTIGNIPYAWESESRPASGSSPIQGKLGWRPCRAWNHSGRRFESPAGTVTQFTSWGTYGDRKIYDNGSYWGTLVSPPNVPAFPNGLVNRAEVMALNRLKQQDINLGTFLAEFRLTADMVTHSALSIAHGVRNWRAINRKSLWDAVKLYERGNGKSNKLRGKIPQSWLELQYGWKPLLSDIFGAIQHLGRPGREPLAHVKGHAISTETLTTTVNPGGSSAILEYDVTHEVWVALYYLLKDAGLAEQSSLGLLNPVEIVWECLPYSFVVDWFLPIGPWMSSLTATAGFTFKGGSRSTKTTVNNGRCASVNWQKAGNTFPKIYAEGAEPVINGKAENFNRSCYSSSPVPGLYVKSPLSTLHVANALALLAQAFR